MIASKRSSANKCKASILPRIVSFLLVIGVGLGLAVPAAATQHESQREVVKVGFFPFEGYHEKSDSGDLSGYGYDILQQMVLYENWQYEYIGYDEGISWNNALTMLDSGEVSLLTSATISDDRLEKYDYSDIPIGESSTMLSVKPGDSTIDTDDYTAWNNIRVGMISGNSRNESFRNYAELHGFEYQKVFLDTPGELKAALDAGTVDMIVTSNLLALDGVRVVDLFDVKPFYVIVKKGNTRLLSEVNQALRQMQDENSDFAKVLQQKYYKPDSNGVISFTKAEQKYIDQCRKDGTVFKAVINADRKPLAYLNSDGEAAGIFYDLSKKIFERTGLNIEIEANLTREQYMQAIQNHEVDIICDFTNTPSKAEKLGYVITEPYYNSSIGMLVRANDTNPRQIGALTKSSVTNSLLEGQEGFSFVYYDTNKECQEAVKKGEVDFAYGYTRAIQDEVYSDITHSFACVIDPNFTIDVKMAVCLHQNAYLSTIISKGVDSITDVDTALASEPYTYYDRSNSSFLSFVYDQPIVIIVLIFAIAFSLILIVMLYVVRKRHLAEAEVSRQLSYALDAEKAANDAKTSFLSRISHDMRTPLNGILGLTSILEEKISDESTLRDVEQLRLSGEYLLDLVTDTLDISRIEKDKLELHPAVCEGRAALNTVLNLTRPNTEAKHLNFVVKAEDLPFSYLYLDVGRVEQVVMNILGNAIKFTPEGGTITFTMENLSVKDGIITDRLIIEDTGVGMSKEFLPHLFEPFTQEDNGITSKTNGTGLGMAITKRIVELMNGTIEVESEPGKGTKFTIVIPLPVATEEQVRQWQKAKNNEYNGNVLSGKRLLLCEDHPLNATITTRLLEKQGIIVEHAVNGEIGVTMFSGAAAGHYDAILMDIRMPIMDGITATRAIRALSRPDAATIPIIALTANAFDEDIKQTKAAGMNAHLSKPIDANQLYEMLGNVLHMQHSFIRKKVLIVDDVEVNREVIKASLQDDYILLEAANGKEAMDLMESSNGIDVVITDIQMPEMNGIELIKQIRSDRKYRQVVIIANTQFGDPEQEENLLALGANDFVYKPTTPKIVAIRVRNALKRL